MQPLPLFIGLRYTRAKRQNHFISFISMVSMAGIALGIAALITVMSVMNGFQKEVRARILGVSAHIQIMGFDAGPVRGLDGWRQVMDDVRKNPDVTGAAPFVDGQGLLSYSGKVRGTMVRGILPDEEDAVSTLGKDTGYGQIGSLVPGEYNIILGSALARAMGVTLGTKVQLITPQGNMTPAGMVPRYRSFTVAGVFSSGHYEYDANLALIHLKDAQVLYQFGENVSGIRVKLKDTDRAQLVSRQLGETLKIDGYVTDWTRQNATYFQAVEIEKRMMFVILMLIIAVAAFNLVSTLVMVVTDKHPDIAILRTLGASPGMIMRIFFVQGAVVGSLGTLIGVVAGVLLAMNVGAAMGAVEHLFGFQALKPEVYILTSLPSDLRWSDVWSTALISLVLAFAATLYPSWRASRVNPAEALRYE
ncbi:MAG: lipoprotein-releasing ABC transporter permease subunit [Betaproteobacteria bacterium]|nr:lipoprotein-releasing ABC transporter permease subunit [Betaproteobacteria bacterium]